ncbi:hypothetical protein K9O30_03865 [Clostridium bowmanii]|uniref:hypothetical protein n=1 Tax=Clostridium bowmanii TaxID=132925 RepID=UPI001C0B70A0|nr:hypothetical protein [Clostridium bowmanii]MBU3188494.1 hypothetical protein [Clostridium bowmanii]MCA1072878.1 hypothetical protein [Clostridium bowmanii]
MQKAVAVAIEIVLIHTFFYNIIDLNNKDFYTIEQDEDFCDRKSTFESKFYSNL